ncbi:gag-pol polyprotein [Tanacetum coccineum]
MEFDPRNPLQKHNISDQAPIRKYFELEVDFMVSPDYYQQQKFIAIRSIAISYIQKFTRNYVDAFVPYLAMTFVDRFLSRMNDIPVIYGGEGVERNMKILFTDISKNSVSERKHRHLVETARSFLLAADVPNVFWGEEVLTAAYVINRIPMAHNSGLSLFEKLYGILPDYSSLLWCQSKGILLS